MPGWRIGWAAGSAEVIAALARVKSFVDTGQFLAVQAAARAALETSAEWVPGNVAEFQARRDAAVGALRDAGFDATPPRATMYLWVPVPRAFDSQRLARQALMQEGVVSMQSAALGAGGQGFFLIALPPGADVLREPARRLARQLETAE